MSTSPLPSSSSPQINKTTKIFTVLFYIWSKYLSLPKYLYLSLFGHLHLGFIQNYFIHHSLCKQLWPLNQILNATGHLLMNKFTIFFIFQNNLMLEYSENFSSELSIQFSHVQLIATPWTTASQAFLSSMNCWSLLKLMSIELVMPSNHLILCRPLLLLPSIFSIIRVFSRVSSLQQVAKVLEFQLQHQSFQ